MSHFPIDWERQQAACPQGCTSTSWTPTIDNRKNEVIKIKFSTKDCQVCSSRSLCTHSSRHTRRTVTIRPQEQYQALMQRRGQEDTQAFAQVSAKRAGIEGALSQGVRMMGLRRSRYIGEAKRICNTLPRLPRSMWFAVWYGSMGFLVLRLGALLLSPLMRLERVRLNSFQKKGILYKVDALG